MALTDENPSREDGLQLLQTGELEASIECLREVLDSDPMDARALNYLGAACAKKGEMGEAIAAFESAVEIEPTHKTYFNLGVAYEMIGSPANARSAFSRALQLNPAYTAASDALARLGPVPEHVATGDQTEEEDQVAAGDETQTEVEAKSIPLEEITPRDELRSMVRSGIIYGTMIGVVWVELLFLLPSLLLPGGIATFGSPLELILMVAAIGAIIGAITGVVSGLTGGGEETGVKVGIVLGIAGGVFMALTGGAAAATFALVIVCTLVGGAVGGYFIGRLTDTGISSIAG